MACDMRFQSLLADSLRCFSKEYTRSWHLSSKELTRRTIVLWDYRILWRDMSLQQMTSFDEEAFFGNYFSFNILWQQASNLNRITSSIIYWTRAREKKKWEEALKSKRKYFTIFSKLWVYYLDRGQLVKVSE